jgi:hypothetical protein
MCFEPKHNHQSGDRVPQSITSDCLSRLEGSEKTGLDEEVIRDVSGIMFAGESVSEVLGPIPAFLTVGVRCSGDGTSG